MRSKTHERALVQAPARLRANVPSYRLRAASYVLRRGVEGVERVQLTERQAHIGFAQHGAKRLTFKRCLLAFLWAQFAFLLQAFFFQIKRKCRNAESVKSLIIVGREGSKPIINNLQLLRPCIGYADNGQPQGLSLRSVKSKISCRLRGNGASSHRTLQVARQ